MFVFNDFNGRSAKAVAKTLVVFLDCFVLFCRVSLYSLIFPSPPALCRYLPRLRVVSSVQQLSVPLQHVCCSFCSLSDLASHSSELLSAFFVVFSVLIFLPFLVWLVLLCSRTRYASISLALP